MSQARFWYAPALLMACLASPAEAQAWLPPGGSSGISLEFNHTYNKKHYDSHGDEVDAGHTRTLSEYLSATYSPSDRWLLVAGIPYVKARYRGDHPHPDEIDNGDYHGTLTDLRLEAHYQAINGPFALAPYVALVTPVTDYETLGHAAPGRGLNELWIGTYLGRSLDEWIPRTYVQGRVNYAFVEQVAGVKHDRINIDAEIGYFFTPALSVSIVGQWQDTDGGIGVPVPPTDPLFPYHDQLAATRFFNVATSIAWSINDRVHTYVMYGTAIHGMNAHKLDQGVSIGLSYVGAP